jgi:serine/threonine-protein kinase PknG
VESDTPRPAPSLFFGPDLLALDPGDEMRPVEPDGRYLPVPSIDAADPGAQAAANAGALTDTRQRIAGLRMARAQFPKSREIPLRLAAALSDSGNSTEAEAILKELGDQDPWDWRVLWFRGRMKLAGSDSVEARQHFDQAYFDLPGEVAPKLALGLAAELSGDLPVAIKMYDLVSRTDPGFVAAVFGLARCHHASGDRKAAVAALQRIPQSSALHLRSRIEAARLLIRRDHAALGADELAEASAVAESLALDGMSKFMLSTLILSAALEAVCSRTVKENRAVKVLGSPLEEVRLRAGLEASLRSMAHLSSGDDRIRLVDRANQVRPRTLL